MLRKVILNSWQDQSGSPVLYGGGAAARNREEIRPPSFFFLTK